MDLMPELFEELLPGICSKETSFNPTKWTSENPLWGHCAIVALLANKIFGGTFMRAFLDGTQFTDLCSHYWNVLPDGKEYDFSKRQFGGIDLKLVGKSTNSAGLPIDREYLLKTPETKRRYELLSSRLESYLQNRIS